jgi:hypothetical protein
MVFFRHLYYLHPPFIDGNPDNSWLMDPNSVGNVQGLRALLRQEQVRWVVKSPDYPKPLAAAFQSLEEHGQLVPVYFGEASTFSNFRIYGQRTEQKVVILEVVE